jgi:hypothetical protein
VAECARLALVPVMVSVYVPAAVEVEVATVSVEVPDPATEVGLKLPVAPLGRPLTLKATAPAKPFTEVTDAV